MNRSIATGLAAAVIVAGLLLGASILRSVLGPGAPAPLTPSAPRAPMAASPEPPVPSPGLPVPSPSAPVLPTAPTVPAPLDEPALMARLREVATHDPDTAIALARQGNERFPNSPDAPERASILIHALAREGRASEARGEAEAVVNRAPDSPWVREIEGFTGAHRHRNVTLDPDGALRIE